MQGTSTKALAARKREQYTQKENDKETFKKDARVLHPVPMRKRMINKKNKLTKNKKNTFIYPTSIQQSIRK